MVQPVSKIKCNAFKGRLRKVSLLAATLTLAPAFAPAFAAGPDANNHIILTLSAPRTPDQINAAIAADPNAATSPATYGLSEITPQVDLLVTPAIELSTSAASDLLTSASNIGLTAMLGASAVSAAINVPGTYTPDFGGAQRDTVASLVGAIKGAVTLAIATSNNYKIATNGKFAIFTTAMAINTAVDSSRFITQEYLKAYLINKRGFSVTSAAWTAFAAAQAIGLALVVPTAYATQWAMAPYFQDNTNRRRSLLSDMTNQENAFTSFYKMSRAFQQQCLQGNGGACRKFENATNNYQSAAANFQQDVRVMNTNYDDAPFANIDPSFYTAYVDHYPAFISTNYNIPQADLKTIVDTIYKTRIATCTTKTFIGSVSSSYIKIRCPLSASYWDVELKLNPLKPDSSGNVQVLRNNIQRSSGTVVSTKTFTVNQANIDTAHYH